MTRSGGTVELLHHFVGDDSVVVSELIDTVERNLGDVTIETVEDAETSMRAKVDILRQSPPDIWDDWPGKNMIPYREADVLADITDLWEEAGFTRAYFDSAKEAAQLDGRYYALPMNIQRQNNLFYRVDLVEEAGVDPKRIDSAAELLAAIEQVDDATDAAGIILPQKRPWPVFDLWDNLVVSVGDASAYEGIFRGGEATQRQEVIRDALEYVQQYRQYSPEDATYDSWQPALDRFAEGDAAFYVMGDWAAGVLQNKEGLDYREDWDAVPFPGTEGTFQIVMDAFMMPTTTDRSETARAVLEQIGSREVMELFTSVRGAVPPRSDASMDGHSEFFQGQMDYYRSATAKPMATRGNGVVPEKRVALLTGMASFLKESDVDRTTEEFVAALSD
ncbi:MAG: ABC transporter substrate-binding protein [Haloarculaceae archaeon]